MWEGTGFRFRVLGYRGLPFDGAMVKLLGLDSLGMEGQFNH